MSHEISVSMNKEQLKRLTEIAAIAEWVLSARDKEEKADMKPYSEVLQIIYRSAYNHGLTEMLEPMTGTDEYIPSELWSKTSSVGRLINDFEDSLFFDLLVRRLSDRDAGIEKTKMPENFGALFAKKQPLINKYQDEFRANGIKNLYIKKSDFRKKLQSKIKSQE